MYKLRLATGQCARTANLLKTGAFCGWIFTLLFTISLHHLIPTFLLHVYLAVSRNATSAVTEPKGPHVKTDIPGPKSKALLKELSKFQVSTET